jgi:hypothetical protein
MSLPIGRKESEVLEFEGRDALKDRDDRKKVASEVVAFLNTRGGEVYVGIREENEIAVGLEPIDHPEEEARKLRDSLFDAIEPQPSPGEVDLAVERDDEGRAVLRIAVQRGRHGPYALVGKGGARRFMVRILDSSRPMSREELAARFSGSRAAEDRPATVRRRLREERDQLLREGEDRIWCAIQPVRELELRTSDPRYATLLSDPQAIGSPPAAPSFHVPFEPEVQQDRLVLRIPDFGSGVKETSLHEDGGIRFEAVLHLLYRHSTGSTSQVINPEQLIGVPLSLLRLAGAVLTGELEEEDSLLVDLALFGVGRAEAVLFPGRWRLPRPGHEARFYEDGDDLTLTRAPMFGFGEIRDAPERCTFRLLRPVYEAFGLREDAIPMEFDPRTGRPKVSG